MGLSQTVSFILNHPLGGRHKLASLGRFARWQLAARVMPGQAVVSYANDARLIVTRGMTGATGNVYVGLHEFEDMAFAAHLLRSGDLFVDIGANIGSYAVLAAKVAGARCLALEPVAATFAVLMDNVRLNQLGELVDARCMAVGEQPGHVRFTTDRDTGNHVVMAGEERAGATQEVPVETLDRLLEGQVPVAIKLDVEGFELSVLKGARATLAAPGLRALVVETNGAGRGYGHSDDVVHQHLLAVGFAPYRYAPFERRLDPQASYNAVGNTLYVRDAAWVEERLRSASAIRVIGEHV